MFLLQKNIFKFQNINLLEFQPMIMYFSKYKPSMLSIFYRWSGCLHKILFLSKFHEMLRRTSFYLPWMWKIILRSGPVKESYCYLSNLIGRFGVPVFIFLNRGREIRKITSENQHNKQVHKNWSKNNLWICYYQY